ncbi:MAG TPA: methyltransferase domain-containing protein [Pyrinomonadaceae bacterium]
MTDARESNSLFVEPWQVERLEDCYFYHTIELPDLGVQKGHWDLRTRFDDYIGGVDVRGKSVLDVGTATGFLSFEAEARGASRVLSFDMSDVRQQAIVPFKGKLYIYDQHDAWIRKWKNAYWLCHRLLNSKADVYYGNIYALPQELGQFDITIVGAVLEHLVDPVSALISIARLTRERMVLVTPLIESNEKIARFEPNADRPEADFTWWTYSVGLYRELLRILGFEIEKITRANYYHEFAGRMEERASLVAVRAA